MSVLTNRRVLAVALAGGLVTGVPTVFAQNPSVLPDAQIESNVLKALAGAPELSTQNIQTSTVYGTVTLTGNVHDESLRTKAENLAARAQGVKKVVDELTLGDTAAASSPDAGAAGMLQQPDPGQGTQPVLQSDGTYAPAPDGSGAQPVPQDAQGGMNDGAGSPPPPTGRQPMTNRYAPPAGVSGGQQAGIPVTVPAGAVLRIRLNRGLDSQHVDPGTPFDGTVLADVVAGNAVAIPRGAAVSGVVVDAKKVGVFKGEGALTLQIKTLTLGGTVYPVETNLWGRNGRDKTASTVNNTVGSSAVGALFGAIVGGGTGAAIGAGVGAGAGLAGSAASPRGQIILPPESVITFTTSAPLAVRTVSEQEMGRLSYAAGPQAAPQPRMRRYYSPYYGYYYAPAPPPPPQL